MSSELTIESPYFNNTCSRCHIPYVPTIEHAHYCEACVKTCGNCGELKTVFSFYYDKARFDEWRKTHPPDDYLYPPALTCADNCMSCNKGLDEANKKLTPKLMEILLKSQDKSRSIE